MISPVHSFEIVTFVKLNNTAEGLFHQHTNKPST